MPTISAGFINERDFLIPGAVEDDLSLFVGQLFPGGINAETEIICQTNGDVAGMEGVKRSPKDNGALANRLGGIGYD